MNYTPTIWENGKKPAINATHLNKMENELARLANIVSVPDITETTQTTMPNSYDGRLLVEEIGGVCEQETTEGKNLAEPLLPTSTSKGVTCTNNGDGTFTLNGTSTGTATFRIDQSSVSGSDNLKSYSGTYSISLRDSNGSLNPSGLELFLTQQDTYTTYLNSNWKKTAEVNVDNCFIYINVAEGTALNNLKVYPQLEKGSAMTEWEPYTGGQPSPNPSYPQEIKKTVVSEIVTHGKNFLNARLNVEFTTNDVYLLDNIVEGETYTVYIKQQVTELQADFPSAQHHYWFWDKDKKIIKNGIVCRLSFDATNQTKEEMQTLVAPLGAKYLRLDLGTYYGSSTTKIKNIECQVEKGDTFTGYEPYTESAIALSQPIELYGIGDVQDVIEGGKVKRRIASVILNGNDSENWAVDASRHLFYTFAVSNYCKVNTLPICTHYAQANAPDDYSQDMTCGINANKIIWLSHQSIDTLDNYKVWLAENPITVFYELAEETTEELPLADQIALNSLATHDGITYLEFDSEIEPTFKGEYGTSKVGGYTLEALLTARSK